MRGQPHLIKRGNVFQWRRRIRCLSTQIVDLKVSLRTTDPKIALILARKLTGESDGILQQLLGKNIGMREAQIWLGHVVQREREKIDNIQLLQRMDASNPEDDRGHDDAFKAAWNWLADHGLSAAPPVNGESLTGSADKMRILSTINLLRANLKSQHVNAVEDFKKLTGMGEVSALDTMSVMAMLIEGKRAAWNKGPAALNDIRSLAEALANGEPVQALPPATPNTQPVQHQPVTPSAEVGPALDEDFVKIPAIIERMIGHKRAAKIDEKTLKQYRSFGQLFVTMIEIDDIRKLNQSHARAFRAYLHEISKFHGKSPKDKTMSRDELLAKAKTMPAEDVGLSVGTINRHLEHFSEVVTFAADEEIHVSPKLAPNKLRLKDVVRDQDKCATFSEDLLRKLFEGPVWTGSQSEYYQTSPGNIVVKNGLFWAPIVCAYTGARREEIAGLATEDIGEEAGIPFLNLHFSELRRLKNNVSIRKVPIHGRLIELGFLDYVEKMRAQGSKDLFPCLREGANGKHGKKLGRKMRDVIDVALGDEGAEYTFQGIRHYVQHHLDLDSNNPPKIVRDIVGHEGKDEHEKVYGRTSPLSLKLEVLHRLPIVF
ncbi:MAG: integrase [Paracoccaceae bacterium]